MIKSMRIHILPIKFTTFSCLLLSTFKFDITLASLYASSELPSSSSECSDNLFDESYYIDILYIQI